MIERSRFDEENVERLGLINSLRYEVRKLVDEITSLEDQFKQEANKNKELIELILNLKQIHKWDKAVSDMIDESLAKYRGEK